MNLFFLRLRKDGDGGRFLRDVSPIVSPEDFEVFGDLASFHERLRKPRDPSSIMLILDPSYEDLRRVVALREFIKESKVLLVLRDQCAETISLAHKILPTYISYLDGGTSGLVAVLKQLMRDAHAKGAKK